MMLWMDVSTGTFKLRDQGQYMIDHSLLPVIPSVFAILLRRCHSMLTVLDSYLPSNHNIQSPTLCWAFKLLLFSFIRFSNLLHLSCPVPYLSISTTSSSFFARSCLAAVQGSWHKLYSSVQLQTLSLTLSPLRVRACVCAIQQTNGKDASNSFRVCWCVRSH